MRIGYFLSSEEWGPRELVSYAKMAEAAGFEALWISDHFHPWNEQQGNSPFVWSVIGALSEATSLPVTTAVTCPIARIHPAVIAQAAATAQCQQEGKFRLGVGTGEALNEHIGGGRWPPASVRLEMLEEAIRIIRLLWQRGQHSYYGRHFTVENAQIYTLPQNPPPVYISGFGNKAIQLAGRAGDGLISTFPDAKAIELFRKSGGDQKITQAGVKVCWGEDPATAVETVHRLWPNEQLPGQLSQDLPTPRHFEQASQLVTKEMVAKAVACGPDVGLHVGTLEKYQEAGFDELYVSQIGPEQEQFFAFYQKEVLPALRGKISASTQ